MFTAQCFHEWDCEDGKASPLPCCICDSASKDRCTEGYKQGYTYWIPKGVMKSIRSTTYAGSTWLRLVHRMKSTSKLPALGIPFTLIPIPPATRLESSHMPLAPLPLSLHSGGKETQTQVSLEPQQSNVGSWDVGCSSAGEPRCSLCALELFSKSPGKER